MGTAPPTTDAPSPAAPAGDARTRWKTALKALATLAIFGLVLWKVPLSDLAARMRHLGAADLAILVVVTIAQVSVGVLRWQRVLARLGERVSFFGLYGDLLVGLTYNMFLPTTVGGDVVRAIRARKRLKVGHRAWSSSIYERIAGLLALAASGAIAAAVGLGEQVHVPPALRWTAIGVAIAFLLAFFGASWPFRLLLGLIERSLGKGGAAAADVRGIVADLEGPLTSAGARLEALGWSIVYQALGIVFVIAGARGLGAPGHELAILVGVPIVHVFSMVPITIGGLGLREGLFVAILGRLGVASDVALGLAAQWLASSVGFALAGAIVALVATVRTPRDRDSA